MNLLVRFFFLCLYSGGHFFAQNYDIQGQIKAKDGPLPFANVFGVKSKKAKFEVFGGVKNILDAYQVDFDSGKNRDSNYVYGPATPRTVFIGLKLGNF